MTMEGWEIETLWLLQANPNLKSQSGNRKANE